MNNLTTDVIYEMILEALEHLPESQYLTSIDLDDFELANRSRADHKSGHDDQTLAGPLKHLHASAFTALIRRREKR
jgi:hypothetical protein